MRISDWSSDVCSSDLIGFDHLVGSIEPGKQADLALFDLSALESQPLYDVVSQLVYATGRHQVSDVWIAGKPKLRDRELTGMDIDAIIAHAKQWGTRLAAIDRAALQERTWARQPLHRASQDRTSDV